MSRMTREASTSFDSLAKRTASGRRLGAFDQPAVRLRSLPASTSARGASPRFVEPFHCDTDKGFVQQGECYANEAIDRIER